MNVLESITTLLLFKNNSQPVFFLKLTNYPFILIADYFEGDLKLTEEEIEELKSSGLSKRDAVSSAARKWTNARVPYILDRSFGKYHLLFSEMFIY